MKKYWNHLGSIFTSERVYGNSFSGVGTFF